MDGEYRLVGTGATIRTGAAGPKVELDSNNFRSYDSSNNVLVEIPTSGGAAGMIVLRAHSTTPGKIVFGDTADIYSSATTLRISPHVGEKFLNVGSSDSRWTDFQILGRWNALVGLTKSAGFTGLAVNAAPSGELHSFTLTVEGGTRIKADLAGLGFFGATPVVKPTVTGDWVADPVACAKSTLAALSALGLVTNSTTNF